MEPQPGFDLNRELTAWRSQLSQQPAITPEETRELEGHLLDAFEAAKRGGQTEQRAFAEALRKVGSAEGLGEEYSKLNPLRNWSHRVAIMVLAIVIVSNWRAIGQTLSGMAMTVRTLGVWELLAFGVVFYGVLPGILLWQIIQGRANHLMHALEVLLRSRVLLGLFLLLLSSLTAFAGAWALWNHPRPDLIFGPDVKGKLSQGVLFWQHLASSLTWIGPWAAMLILMAPKARQTLLTVTSPGAWGLRQAREVVLWTAVGYMFLSASSGLTSTVWLFPPLNHLVHSLLPMNGITSHVQAFLLNVVPVAVLGWVSMRQGPFFAAKKTGGGGAFWSAWRIASVGAFSFIVPYGLLGLTLSFSPSNLAMWLISTGVWHAIFTGIVVWLLPACQLQSACVPAESRVE